MALARHDVERAVLAGASAIQALQEGLHEDMNLDVLLPAARAILAGGPEEMKQMAREWLQVQLSGIAQRTLDEDARVRWLRGRRGRELAELAGPIVLAVASPGPGADGGRDGDDLNEVDRRLLHLLTEGKTNREIGQELGLSEEEAGRRLGEIFATIGASSRAEATTFAFREGMR